MIKIIEKGIELEQGIEIWKGLKIDKRKEAEIKIRIIKRMIKIMKIKDTNQRGQKENKRYI